MTVKLLVFVTDLNVGKRKEIGKYYANHQQTEDTKSTSMKNLQIINEGIKTINNSKDCDKQESLKKKF